MRLDFTRTDLLAVCHNVNPQVRRSIVGMLFDKKGNTRGNDFETEVSAVRFLEKQKLATVDWTWQCSCGLCLPEPRVDLAGTPY